MKPTWILVCGRDGARLFEHSGKDTKIRLVETFLHPEGRLKEQDIVTDRAGRNFHRTDKVTHSGGRTGDARAHSDHLFAQEIARYLKKSRESSVYGRLHLVASPHFMGILKGVVDPVTLKSVTGMLDKDLAHFSEEDLYRFLSEELIL